MKKIKKIAILVLLILFICINNNAKSSENNENYKEIRYFGKVTDFKNQPIKNAEILVSTYKVSKYIDTIFKVNSQGNFDFKFSTYNSNVTFTIGAEFRNAYKISINTAYKDDDYNLNFKLGGYPEKRNKDSIYLIVYNNKFERILDTVMTKIETKGEFNKYSFDLQSDSDTIFYQIGGYGLNTRNGTQFDYNKNDGSCDFLSCIVNKNIGGITKIVFDESLLPDYKFNTEFDSDDEFLKDIINVNNFTEYFGQTTTLTSFIFLDDSIKRQHNYDSIVNEILNYKYKTKFKEVEYSLMKEKESLIDWMNGSLELSKLPIIEYKFNMDYFLDSIPDNAKFWEENYMSINHYYFSIDTNKTLRFFDKFKNNKNRNVQAVVILHQIYFYKYRIKDSLKADELITRAVKDYRDTYHGEQIFYQFSKEKPITIGKKMLDFSLPKFTDSLENYNISLESLKGKYVLFDFWATWCGPCIAELPNLIKAYEELKSDKFEIISISIDPDISLPINNYKKKKNMPWINVFAEGAWSNKLVKDLGIKGIPSNFVIDPNGIIVNEGSGLRGEELLQTLKKILNVE